MVIIFTYSKGLLVVGNFRYLDYNNISMIYILVILFITHIFNAMKRLLFRIHSKIYHIAKHKLNWLFILHI